MSTESEPSTSRSRLRRLQFSIRSVLILATITCVVLAFDIAPELRRRRQQAKLEAYQEKWVELGWINRDASCDEEVTELGLYDTQLTTLPPEIGQLTNLTGLSLHGVQFTTLPSEIGKLTKLVYLGLGGNQFTTLPPEIGQLTNLIWLYLEGNQLTALPPEIGKLTKLTELQIEKTPLTDTDLEHLKSLKSLKRLNVRDTKVTIAGVEAFRKELPNCEIKVPRQSP